MQKQLLLVGLLFLSGISPIFCQKYSNEFLAIGVGGRAHGMSGAQTALANDLSAIYWNAAGLSEIDAPVQLAAMHAEWFGGVGQYDFLSFGKALNRDKKAFLAFSLIRLGIDQIPYTINLVEPDGTINYDNISEFSAADYALMGSYARKLRNPNFSVGGTVKVVRRVIGSIGNSWGFGADLGMQYRKGNLMLGVQGRDLTTTFNAWSFNFTDEEKEVLALTNNEIPISSVEITRPQLVLGITRRFQWKNVGISPEIDLIATTDGRRNTLISAAPFSIDPAIGLELDYKQKVFLRGGASQFQREIDFGGKELLGVRPAIGVSAGPRGLGDALKLPKGVVLVDVGRGSPAEKAGLQPFRRGNRGEVVAGDVITAIGDQPVADLDDMLEQLERHQPGDTVTLTLWRAGQSRKQAVVLGKPE